MTTCSGVQFQLGLKRRRVQCTAIGRGPKNRATKRGHRPKNGTRFAKSLGLSVLFPSRPGCLCRAPSGLGSLVLFPGLGPILSIFWPRASRSSSRLGGTSGQTHGHRPKNRWRRRPKNRLCQVSLYVRLSSVPRRACLVLCLPVCYSISAFHNRSHDGHREAFRLLMTGHFSRLRCPGVLFVLKLCKTAKCPSFVCYRFGCTFQVLVFHFKREHAVGRRARISQEMTSGAVSAYLVRQRIHEPTRQSTDFGKITFFNVKVDLRSRGRHSSLRLLVLVRLRCTRMWIFWEMTSGPDFAFSLLLADLLGFWQSGARCPPPRGEECEKSWIPPDFNYVWFSSGYRSCISSQSLCGIYKTVNIES